MSVERKPVVIASVLEDGAQATLRRVTSVPRGCGLVEVRADLLPAEELSGVIREAGRPVLVTVRRAGRGGRFSGSEAERRAILEAALRAGAHAIDVEWDSELVELARLVPPERLVVSHHGAPCRAEALHTLYREMSSVPGARLKIVPRAQRVGELSAVRETLDLALADGRALACFAMGRAGAASRVLCASWGSWATYGAVCAGAETAEGQIEVEDLLDVYRVLDLGPATRVRALVGAHVAGSPSPAMHNAAYRESGIDARYLAVETDDLDDVLPLLGAAVAPSLDALAVTRPFKETAALESEPGDDVARAARAVNTVVLRGGRRIGYNTDGPAIRSLLERHITLRGARVACVGAGGTGRAAAAALCAAGAEVTLFNRSAKRLADAAAEIGVASAALGGLGAADWDALVQATPLGAAGEEVLPADRLRGRIVLDAVYLPRETPLVRAARARGLIAVDGLELLVEQAVRQHLVMTGVAASRETMMRAGHRWLSRREPGGA